MLCLPEFPVVQRDQVLGAILLRLSPAAEAGRDASVHDPNYLTALWPGAYYAVVRYTDHRYNEVEVHDR